MFLNINFILDKGNPKKRFKTFNEYELKGIPFDNQETDLYVLVDEQEDTVKVQISNNLSGPVVYINKQDYWFSLSTIRTDVTFNVWSIEYNEKYIFNDTVLNYNYIIHKDLSGIYFGSDYILVETKYKKLYLWYDNEITDVIREKEDESYRFKTIKRLVNDYEDIFIRRKYPYFIYPIRYYYSYNKVLKNDTLFLYDEGGRKKTNCIYDVRLLNSLGEYDPEKGRSIIGSIDCDERCGCPPLPRD